VNAASAVELGALGVVRIRGPDAARFLQGQLSNDVTRLEREPSLIAGFHNPQGRAIAVLRLAALAREDFLAILPRELAAPVVARLQRLVLRAKVRLGDESGAWRVRGLTGSAAREAAVHIALPGGLRVLEVSAAAGSGDAADSAPAEREAWTLQDIGSGLPQVYGATTESFVAQMLNLDLIDGVSFDKGCYTGQEVIARAHYRGRVKRRLQRFRTLAPTRLAPGDDGRLADGRAFTVVEAARHADGCCEFLAVAPLAVGGGEPHEPEASHPSGAVLAVETLSLPYPLPV